MVLTAESSVRFDALHTYPTLLETVENKGGIYLAQIKKNQKELFEECQRMVQNLPFKYDFEDVEKAHGKIEHRIAGLYSLEVVILDARWQVSGIELLVVVCRKRKRTKDRKISQEVVYFVSNKTLINEIAGNELYRAVRNHWSVESDNFVKDVNLGEDHLKCCKTNRSRAIASIFNVAVNLLRRKNITNNLRLSERSVTSMS